MLTNGEGSTYAVRCSNFDRFLLDEARTLGTEVIPNRVTGFEWTEQGQPQPVQVYSEGIFLRAEVVVGAFSLNEPMLSVLSQEPQPWGAYQRPWSFPKTFVAKPRSSEKRFVQQKFGDIAHVLLFPRSLSNIEFASLTPKENHIVINIAGRRLVPWRPSPRKTP